MAFNSQHRAMSCKGGRGGSENSEVWVGYLPRWVLSTCLGFSPTEEIYPETQLQPEKSLPQPLGSSCLERGCCCYLFVQPQHPGHYTSATAKYKKWEYKDRIFSRFFVSKVAISYNPWEKEIRWTESHYQGILLVMREASACFYPHWDKVML